MTGELSARAAGLLCRARGPLLDLLALPAAERAPAIDELVATIVARSDNSPMTATPIFSPREVPRG